MKNNSELYVPVPVDPDAVKSKVLMGLTLRQIICFGAGAFLGVGVYIWLKDIIGTSFAGLLMVFLMLPAFLLAVYEQNGEHLETIIARIRAMKKRPAERIYKSESDKR